MVVPGRFGGNIEALIHDCVRIPTASAIVEKVVEHQVLPTKMSKKGADTDSESVQGCHTKRNQPSDTTLNQTGDIGAHKALAPSSQADSRGVMPEAGGFEPPSPTHQLTTAKSEPTFCTPILLLHPPPFVAQKPSRLMSRPWQNWSR